ncbi:MAG: rhodanese-like domain-containing protein [Chloroflexi bacterium]|nr:rhodanese-like domain-containing protein [Chloroflexota bacterium]MBI1856109.1 rhodanese-like domain-containing protein [Chloroflexota bacterium]MBI3339185.1 rhodanese-like domain-containing protein [Chloroflexota bacterium]
MKRFLILLFIFGLTLAACQNKPAQIVEQKISVPGGSYTNVSADELNTMLKNKDFVFINVHTPFAGNIAGTDLSIPYDQIGQNLSQLPADKNAKLVLYCRSGRMSAIAAETLVKLGYTNVLNLNGGMDGWEQAGYLLEGK